MITRLIIIFFFITAESLGNAQQLRFIDDLFEHSVSKLDAQISAHSHSEIEWLKSDYGLSFGGNYRNQTDLDDINGDSGARVFLKFDALKTGLKSNFLEAKKLELAQKISELEPNRKVLQMNSSFYANYISYCYSIEKAKTLNEIISKARDLQSSLTKLYYTKAISYEEIYAAQQVESDYNVLANLNDDLLLLFEHTFNHTEYPSLTDFTCPELNFAELNETVRKFSKEHKKSVLEKKYLETQAKQKSLPYFNITGGVNVADGRPYYSINFSQDLKRTNREQLNLAKAITEENAVINSYQLQKRLRVIQGDFEFKRKKINHLTYEVEKLKEKLELIKIKRKIQNLDEGITEEKMNLELLTLEFEILSLYEESYLDLKNIRTEIAPMPIEAFLKKTSLEISSKFMNNRFIILDQNLRLTHQEEIFLKRNEITVVNDSSELNGEILMINPENFHSRVQMERYMNFKADIEPVTVFVFKNLQTLIELDRRTLENMNRQISFNQVKKLE